jgi:hypothetical protein
MQRPVLLVACLAMLAGSVAPAAAAVNVERRSDENPMIEVARSTLYGGLAGLMVGGAIALIDEDDDNGDIVKWGFVTGTFVGLGMGLWWTSQRPSAALLEFDGGTLRAHAPPPVEVGVTRLGEPQARLRVIGARF